MLKFFAEENVSSFCNAKATHIFSAKNIRILYIESAKTVNEMTLNELVKLTMLWTTGPSLTFIQLMWYQEGESVIMKGSVQWSAIVSWSLPLEEFKINDLVIWSQNW